MVISRSTTGLDYINSAMTTGQVDIDVWTIDTFQNLNYVFASYGQPALFAFNVTYRQLGMPQLYSNSLNAFPSSVPPAAVPPYFFIISMPWARASLVRQIQVRTLRAGAFSHLSLSPSDPRSFGRCRFGRLTGLFSFSQ